MKFLNGLVVQYIDGKYWEVMQPFDYALEGPDNITIHVPVGFITDFASIPKIFWNILPSTSWYGPACLLHDLLYQTGKLNDQSITRKQADDILDEAMRVLAAEALEKYGAPDHEFMELLGRKIIYFGVRFGGWVAWNHYRKLEQQNVQK